jgi:tRNA A37 threonylcarbamoyltransferase TsaD
MKNLTQNLYTLISRGINTHGTYDPSVISYTFEEEMTAKQYDAIVPFLQWCHDNGKMFGRANYSERYQEYLNR